MTFTQVTISTQIPVPLSKRNGVPLAGNAIFMKCQLERVMSLGQMVKSFIICTACTLTHLVLSKYTVPRKYLALPKGRQVKEPLEFRIGVINIPGQVKSRLWHFKFLLMFSHQKMSRM